MELISINEVIVVEGHYDVMRLQEIISSPVIETSGFAVFNDKAIQQMIKELADRHGIIILTDSDASGFKIRAFVAQLVAPDKVKHAYIPEIEGLEKRKSTPSKANLIGVEGVGRDVLRNIIMSVSDSSNKQHDVFDTTLFYSLGLSGKNDSAAKRRQILTNLGLPTRLTTRSMCRLLPYIITIEQLKAMIKDI